MPSQSLALFSVDRQPQAAHTPAKWIDFPGSRYTPYALHGTLLHWQSQAPISHLVAASFPRKTPAAGASPPISIRGCARSATQPV